MKKILVVLITILLCACNGLPKLPEPELADGIRGSQFGIDKNINESTIDNYLNRSDSVYIDCRMLKDEANYEAIDGDSYLSGYVKGFEVVPYPYLCNVVGLPPEVGSTYSGTTLFTQNDDGTYSANYEESNRLLEALFPKDKVIFLMCGGGGYAGMTKNLLISQGYDASKIYNTGGFWYYEGKNAVSTKTAEGLYDFSSVKYHEINFKELTPVEGYNPNPDIQPREDSSIIQVNEIDSLINDKKSFGLLVTLPGCTSCAAFRPIVEEVADSKQLDIYEISLKALKENGGYEDIKYTPTMMLFRGGKLLAYLSANAAQDTDYYKDAENLSKWFAKYINFEIVKGSATNDNPDCTGDSACSF